VKDSTQHPELLTGVFADLGTAFIDTVRVSFTASLVPRPWKSLTEISNRPCGGPKAPYGRSSKGVLDWTGNRYRVNYSKWSRFANVPEGMLWLDSEQSPLTGAEIRRAMRSFSKHNCAISGVDLAWDLHSSFDEIAGCLVSRGTRRRLLLIDPKTGRGTLYFGTRQGERQVCLYDKAPGIVRLEVRLHRRALRRLGITSPKQLPKLRQLDLRLLFSVCELRVPGVVKERWRRNALRHCADRQPLDTLIREIAQQYGVPLKDLVRSTALDARLRSMQRKLVC
jgi:hypothetical protein